MHPVVVWMLKEALLGKCSQPFCMHCLRVELPLISKADGGLEIPETPALIDVSVEQ